MLRTAFTFVTAGFIAAIIIPGAQAGQKEKIGQGISAEDGRVVYDDLKLDGKGCVVGAKAKYDPKTGEIVKVRVVKCN